MNPAAIDRAVQALRSARRVAVLTGAGVSAESGLRTFRGATAPDSPPDMAALWKEFDPMRLATPQAFEADPAMVTRWYDWRRLGCLAAEPNAGHMALARLERWTLSRDGAAFTLLTQNVDRLHQRAGSKAVVELHGSIIEWRCTKSGRRTLPPTQPFTQFPPPSQWGGLLRPDVVWFGEMLPEDALRRAEEAAGACDVFLTVGTSAVVWPAAGYIHRARATGATTIEVNPDQTAASDAVDIVLRGTSAAVLPAIVAALLE